MKRIAICLLLAGCLDPNEDGNLVPKTVDEDPSIPAVEINGTKVHLETFGDPNTPVIIVLHGGPGTDYRSMLNLRQPVDGVRLEDHHFVVFWDQRGCGLSRRHDAKDVKLANYDADMLALIQRFSPGRPVVLLGHSWGAMYASFFTSQHPDLVKGSVLMDSGPLTGARFEEVKDGIMHLDYFSEWLNDTAWADTFVSPQGHARRDYMLLLGSLGDSEPGFHIPHPHPPVWRLGAVASQSLQLDGLDSNGNPAWNFSKGLDHYPNPVLFEGAELNTVTGAEFQRRQMVDYANAELAVIQGEGHEFPFMNPQATLRPIFNYLTKIGY